MNAKKKKKKNDDKPKNCEDTQLHFATIPEAPNTPISSQYALYFEASIFSFEMVWWEATACMCKQPTIKTLIRRHSVPPDLGLYC